jgi:hypothetical protein
MKAEGGRMKVALSGIRFFFRLPPSAFILSFSGISRAPPVIKGC